MRVEDDRQEVAVVRWPADALTRTLLAADRRPRLLVIGPDTPAPAPIDDLEDWVRDPIDPSEVLARSQALRRRVVRQAAVPHLDDDGLLHFDGRWVAVPDAQMPLIALLVERFGELVRSDELTTAYIAAGGTANQSSIRTAIMRVRTRVGEVGLRLESARRRGFVLQPAR